MSEAEAPPVVDLGVPLEISWLKCTVLKVADQDVVVDEPGEVSHRPDADVFQAVVLDLAGKPERFSGELF